MSVRPCRPDRGDRHDDPDNSGLCIHCGAALDEGERITEAELSSLHGLYRSGAPIKRQDALALVAEVRRLRGLIVLAVSGQPPSVLDDYIPEAVQAEARAIRAGQ
jgi:hypothetical protein